MIDITKHPEIIAIINSVLNNDGIVEVKNEARRGEENIVVVELTRTVRTHRKPKQGRS